MTFERAPLDAIFLVPFAWHFSSLFLHSSFLLQEDHGKELDSPFSYPTKPEPARFTLRRGDLAYVLDPEVGSGTDLGTFVEGQDLLRPRRPRGPEQFPRR